MTWDWAFAVDIMPTLLRATGYTLLATSMSYLWALLLALPIALLRDCRSAPARRVTAATVEFVRSTPILVQIYFLYFALPRFGLVLPAIATGVIALSVHYSAYISETYRAGLASVSKGQREASAALGLRPWAAFVTVVLPQALSAILPALGNHLIALFKETPLLSAIAIVELLQTAKLIGSDTFRYTEPITLVGLIFLAISLLTAVLLRAFERHITRWRT